MLSKRILSLSFNCRKLIFAPKLTPLVSACQVKGITDHVKLNVDDQSHKVQYNSPESKSSSIVLDLLKLNFNKHSLSSSDTIKALTKLTQLCKQESLPPNEVVHEDFFKNLCIAINSQTNDLNISETIQILDLLRSLKVRSSSETIQNLLERVNKLLSTASFSDYNKIMQIIQKIPTFPAAREIKMRLIKKFILKVSSEFDEKEPGFLIEALRFACLHTQDKKILKTIIVSLRNTDFDTQSPDSIVKLMDILTTLTYYSQECDEILVKAQNAYIKNIPQISNKDIVTTLRRTAWQLKKKRENFYNKTLFDEAIKKLISTECSLEESAQCLHVLMDVKHTSKELLNYMASEIYAQKEIDGKDIDDTILSRMLEGFVDLKYKPFCWETFLEVLKIHHYLKLQRNEPGILLYRIYHLACLDCYRPKILEKVFETNFNFQENRHLHHVFLKLYQKLKTTPDYNGPMPSEKQIESFEHLMREIIEYPLFTSLMEGSGGPEYVKTNIRSKLYHQIDHVVAFDPEGNPVAFDDTQKEENTGNCGGQIEYLENLNIPQDCQLVAVAFAPSAWYARNTNEMLGKYAAYFETLEALSCQVVTICDKVWLSLPKQSRTAFLMDSIKNKLKSTER